MNSVHWPNFELTLQLVFSTSHQKLKQNTYTKKFVALLMATPIPYPSAEHAPNKLAPIGPPVTNPKVDPAIMMGKASLFLNSSSSWFDCSSSWFLRFMMKGFLFAINSLNKWIFEDLQKNCFFLPLCT